MRNIFEIRTSSGSNGQLLAKVEAKGNEIVTVWFERKPAKQKPLQFIEKIMMQVKPKALFISFTDLKESFDPLTIFSLDWAKTLLNKSEVSYMYVCLTQEQIDNNQGQIEVLVQKIKQDNPLLYFKIYNMVIKAETDYKSNYVSA